MKGSVVGFACVAVMSAALAIDYGKPVQDVDYGLLRARLERDGLPLR